MNGLVEGGKSRNQLPSRFAPAYFLGLLSRVRLKANTESASFVRSDAIFAGHHSHLKYFLVFLVHTLRRGATCFR